MVGGRRGLPVGVRSWPWFKQANKDSSNKDSNTYSKKDSNTDSIKDYNTDSDPDSKKDSSNTDSHKVSKGSTRNPRCFSEPGRPESQDRFFIIVYFIEFFEFFYFFDYFTAFSLLF